jgi:Big-like domain-containing protein/VCBS repeat protein
LLGNGDGTFQPGQIFNSGGSSANALVAGDVNRDGKTDLVVSNACNTYPPCNQGRIGVLLGNGGGTFQSAQPYASGVYLGQTVALADLNGDHKLDVMAGGLSTNGGSGAVTVFLGTTVFSTTTTLTSNPNPSVQGQAVTLTATVTSTGDIQPTGKVTFTNGGVVVGGASLVGGVATLTKRNLPVGTLSLTTAYHGDTQSAKSTSPVVIQVVNPSAGRP